MRTMRTIRALPGPRAITPWSIRVSIGLPAHDILLLKNGTCSVIKRFRDTDEVPLRQTPSHGRLEQINRQKETIISDTRALVRGGGNQSGIGLQIASDSPAHGFTCWAGPQSRSREAAAKDDRRATPARCSYAVRDQASISAVANRIRDEFGRLDVLISERSDLEYEQAARPVLRGVTAKTTLPTTYQLDEMRAVWDNHVFGVLAVYQRCCRCCARPPAGASSTCRAALAR